MMDLIRAGRRSYPHSCTHNATTVDVVREGKHTNVMDNPIEQGTRVVEGMSESVQRET
jgi:hypothetical protein